MADRVIGSYDAAVSIDGSTNYLLIQPGSSSTPYKKINRNVFLGVTGQPADISSSQSLTNKTLDNTNTITLKDTLFTLQDDGDVTKQAQFQLSGITAGQTRVYTLPNATGTLADLATAQTFTNKTLTAPVITNGSITGTTITTNAIVGQSSASSGTVYGLSIASGKVGTNGVVTNSITNSAVDYTKVATGFVVQVVNATFSALATGTTTIPIDDTIPQIGEGNEYMTLSITPKSATNILVIEVKAMLSSSAAATSVIGALFQDATANALAATMTRAETATAVYPVTLTYTMAAGTTSPTTFRFRGGAAAAGTTTFNGSAGGRLFGAIVKSSIVITEYKA